MLIFDGPEKSLNALFLLEQFLRRFRETAGLTPAVILGLQLHEAEAPEEGALFKPGEFGEGFFSKSIARFWRPVRILVN